MTLDIPVGLGATIAFLFGASVGSFVTTVAYRMPRDLSLLTPRSFCESCERAIPWWANVPILAYIGLRGRCLMCGASISFRHFLAELGLAIAALYLYLNFPLADAVARFVLCSALFIVALIDYDWRLIPNMITMPGIPIGIVAAALAMPEVGLKSAVIGVFAGGGSLFVTGYVYEVIRGREGVGMGDVWLIAMVGGFLGWQGMVFTLFFGSVFGAVGGLAYALGGGKEPAPVAEPGSDVIEKDASILRTEIPFGPFLALAAGIYALFQPQMTRWYLGG